MRRAGLRLRLTLWFLVFGVIASAGVILLASPSLGDDVQARQEAVAGAALTALLSEATTTLPDEDAEGRVALLNRLAASAPGESRLLAPSGKVIRTASLGPARLLDGPPPMASIRSAIDTPGRVTVSASVQGGQVVARALGATVTGEVIEVARLVPEDTATVDAFRERLVLSVLAVMFMAVLIGSVVARRLASRIGAVADAAGQVAAGDLSARSPSGGPREVALLADAIDQMADQLQVRLKSVQAERDRAVTLVGALEEGVIAVDRDGVIVIANPSAREILGSTVMAGAALPPDLAAIVTAPHGEAELSRDGRDYIVEWVGIPEWRGQVITLRDVTGPRRLDRQRRELAANVSHELKTPLTAIRGLLELLAQDGESLTAEQREFVEIMLGEQARMSQLVEELLELARLDAGSLRLVASRHDLTHLVHDVVSARRDLAARDGLTIVARVPTDPVWADVDRLRLEQVLFILLDNAMRHTPRGGRIAVAADHGSDGAPTVRVEDTGEGIAEDEIPFIFDRFWQGDPSRATGGAGLGLAIAHGLISAHGGAITVDSDRSGGGTRFTITLPVLPD